jgi:hypothetical protein
MFLLMRRNGQLSWLDAKGRITLLITIFYFPCGIRLGKDNSNLLLNTK